MPRPKLSAEQNKSKLLQCRVSISEREQLYSNARQLGQTPTEYMRARILGGKVPARIAAQTTDPAKIAALNAAAVSLHNIERQIAAIGNNLNQITHAAHIGREMKSMAQALKPEIEAELSALREQRRKTTQALDRLLAEDDPR